MKTFLVLDMNNLAYRALHALGDLSHQDVATGVLFGIFRDIIYLQDRFKADHFAFCFDQGTPLREKAYPDYKITRRTKRQTATDDDKQARVDMKDQVRKLRDEYLPEIGHKNIFYQEGYEADDMIASIAVDEGFFYNGVLVSSDSDMLQLITKRISIWNPHTSRLCDFEAFTDKWGITPKLWPTVKAIAGCETDDIMGVPGVAEKTAVKYILNQLNPATKTYKMIVEMMPIWEDNLHLVSLPYKGVRDCQLVEDKPDKEAWIKIAKKLGMNSLIREIRGNQRWRGVGIEQPNSFGL